MEAFAGFICMLLIAVFGATGALKWVLKSVNWWRYEFPLGERRFSLPPGDMEWPYIGNMLSFLRAFKSTTPDSFTDNLANRFGNVGIYKTLMFGSPSIIVTTAEACRKVLTDDEAFKPGWPSSTMKLMGRKSFIGISDEEHKRLRKLTATPVNGHEALSMYLKFIEKIVIKSLDTWSHMGQIEFLTHVRKLTFKIIMHIFLSSEGEQVREALEREYTQLNYGVRAMPINIPGFVYYNALKARKKIATVLQHAVNSRRLRRKENPTAEKVDMLDLLLEEEDEKGRKLDDEEIVDVLLMYLNAGHESSGHTTMWATIYLQNNSEIMRKAKDEAEEIVRRRPSGQQGLTYHEYRQMNYLNRVVDETLRIVTFSLTVFREAKKDFNISGYTIPKGWKVLVWFRGPHFDSGIYPEPRKFDPDRWEGLVARAGTFLPFGAGTRLCPGNDLARLEITVFLHYFILGYELERFNPTCEIMHLPHVRPKDNCLGRIRRLSSSPVDQKKQN